jgi:2-dehydro-3-deoxygluconokinase
MHTNAPRIVGIGEAMVELSPAGEGLYRLGFAGDTFNTVWHMAQLLGDRAAVGFCTRIGIDALSDRFAGELAGDGLDPAFVGRDEARHMGLYLIELSGTERSFQYWRGESAACSLADQPARLEESLAGTSLIHVSGITLAILAPPARKRLQQALGVARRAGARVSFDPNVRPILWPSLDEARAAILTMVGIADIVLPSFDDERLLWGDASPADTVRRYRDLGVAETTVKNGSGPVICAMPGEQQWLPTPPVAGIVDTTGAGDAFNAGYLAARCRGLGQSDAVAAGRAVSAEVLRSAGARAHRDTIRALGSHLFGSQGVVPAGDEGFALDGGTPFE